MIKQKILFLISGILFAITSSLLYYTYAEEGTLTLEITGFGIRHGTPENLSL